MKKYLLAPLLAALVMFFWGFAYYGLSGIPYRALQTAPDTGPALKDMFPTSGTYVIPDPRGEEEATAELLKRGPIATVHIRREGSAPMDPMQLGQGFLLEFVCCALLALLMGRCAGGYVSRVTFAVLAGILITLFSHGGEAIWWQQDWGWHRMTMLHDVVAWLGAGIVLAIFVKPTRTAA